MSSSYVNLHLHTEYSLLDGHGLCKEYAERAAELGHSHLAMTDHGTLAAAPKFHSYCTKAGVIPIIGLEAYSAPSGRQIRDTKHREQFHLTLLAINGAGYQNLVKLAAHGATDGFYYRPRIDWDLLTTYNEGIVCLSGCMASELSRAILNNDPALQDKIAEFYSTTFPGRYFLEFQNHGQLLPDQRIINQGLYKLALRFGLPGVGTNDSHFCLRGEYEAQKLLTAINSGQKKDNSVIGSSPYNYLRSDEEMALAFGKSALIRNTLEIASWVTPYDLGTPQPKLPVAPQELIAISTNRAAQSPKALLHQASWDGMGQRFTKMGYPANQSYPKDYFDRMTYELRTIDQMGEKLGVPFGRYILNVAAVTDFCKEKGIRFGPRGSAAGSIVCWALGISEPDPIKEGLYFERFLNSERVELPDIDIDVADERRDEVMQFIVEQYGEKRVAKIGTYSAIGAKMALRDAAKALSHELVRPYLEVSAELTALVPNDTRPGGMPLDEVLEMENSPLTKAGNDDNDAAKVILAAKMIAGRLRQESTNAAGVVICDRPVTDLVPVSRVKDPEKATIKIQTAFEKEWLEELGILKMDILGLSTLSVLEETVNSIERTTGARIEPWAFPTDDESTWQTIWDGHTMALFQLGSKGMTKLIREFKPANMNELALVIAFYRPGPMQSLQEIVRRKQGESPIEAPHSRLETILAPTYGIPVYQEQIMQMMQEVAGFTLGKADLVRKAIGKKKRDLMATFEVEFEKGGVSRGFMPADLNTIWNFILPFADYGFNKAHAICYAYVAYQSAYLKTHYSQIFYASALTVEARGGSKAEETPQMRIGTLALEARRRGIDVLPPHINFSQPTFTPEGESAVRYGLAAIKGVGMPDALTITKNAPFGSLADLVVNARPKRTASENLISVGAVPFGNRAALLDALPDAMTLTKARRPSAMQPALFGGFEEMSLREIILRPLPELPRRDVLAIEQERLGMFTSPLPLVEIGDTTAVAELPYHIGEGVTFYGIIASIREISTKKGDRMAFVSVSDGTAAIDVTIFPILFEDQKAIFKEGGLIAVIGKVEDRGDGVSVLASTAFTPEVDEATLSQIAPTHQELVEVTLCLNPAQIEVEDAINRLKQALEVITQNPGPITTEIGYGVATERHRISRLGAQTLLTLGATPTYQGLSAA